jgi:hypothetical protein
MTGQELKDSFEKLTTLEAKKTFMANLFANPAAFKKWERYVFVEEPQITRVISLDIGTISNGKELNDYFETLTTPEAKRIFMEKLQKNKEAYAMWYDSQFSVGGRRNKKRYTRKRKWSLKYKQSINCKKPKGFSQKQYCKYGRKK